MTDTTKPEKNQPGATGEGGWCTVASGLCTDKTRIVIKTGFATKEEADEAAFHEAVSEPAGMGTRAAREPKSCKVVRVRAAEKGLLEPLETIEEKAAWEDALRLTEQDSDARIVYPAWTFGKKAATAAAAVVLAAAVGCGVAFAAGQPVPVEANAPAVASQAPSPTPERKAEKSAVVLTVEAEGAEAGATKAKIVTTGESGEVVVAEKEVEANEATEIGKLPEGDYELHVTAAPVCEDGSSYKLPDKPVKFKVDGEGADVKLEVKLEKIAADKMTKEQLEASAAALEKAGNPSAAQGVKEKSESAVSEPGSDNVVKRDPTPAPDNGSGGNGGSGNSGGGTSNGGGSSSESGGTAPTPTPAPHEHSWSPVTAQQWVANNVWVEDSPAWDEQVASGSYILCSCGFTCDTNAEWTAHNKALGFGNSHSYSVQTNYTTIHHEATGHYEDQGHYETVTTGYSCSCGATK